MSTKKQTSSDNLVLEKEKVFIPKKYKVIIHNDDFTSFEFVISILVQIFNKTMDESEQIATAVHKTQRGIVGIYPKDVAMTKVKKANEIIKECKQCLKITTEEE
jgi:ATP-dependent Clp protease adaptor protein ClpS